MSKRAIVAVALACFVIVAGSAAVATRSSGGAPSTKMGAANLGWAGSANTLAKQGQTFIFGGIIPCIDGAGSVTVTKISLAKSSGLALTGWGWRPRSPRETNGAKATTLATSGVSSKPVAVSNAECSKHVAVTDEFAVECTARVRQRDGRTG